MHNPLRSEVEMFRVVVGAGIAAAPVIALGLLVGPAAAAIALGVELGMGVGMLWRSSRGAKPQAEERS